MHAGKSNIIIVYFFINLIKYKWVVFIQIIILS